MSAGTSVVGAESTAPGRAADGAGAWALTSADGRGEGPPVVKRTPITEATATSSAPPPATAHSGGFTRGFGGAGVTVAIPRIE